MPIAQLNKLLNDLDSFSKIFDLTRDRLAQRAQEIVAETILQDMEQELDPDGSPWQSLSPDYAERKQQLVGNQPMAVLWGTMRTMDNLRGQQLDTTPTDATFVFGQDEQSQLEAAAFQDPTNPNQPAREFYSLGIPTVAKLDQFFDAEFNRLVK